MWQVQTLKIVLKPNTFSTQTARNAFTDIWRRKQSKPGQVHAVTFPQQSLLHEINGTSQRKYCVNMDSDKNKNKSKRTITIHFFLRWQNSRLKCIWLCLYIPTQQFQQFLPTKTTCIRTKPKSKAKEQSAFNFFKLADLPLKMHMVVSLYPHTAVSTVPAHKNLLFQSVFKTVFNTINQLLKYDYSFSLFLLDYVILQNSIWIWVC